MAKFCKYCGDPITEGEVFCDNCGKPIEAPPPPPPKPVCARCGAELTPSAKFCKSCGAPVAATAAPAAASAGPARTRQARGTGRLAGGIHEGAPEVQAGLEHLGGPGEQMPQRQERASAGNQRSQLLHAQGHQRRIGPGTEETAMMIDAFPQTQRKEAEDEE